MFYSLQMGGVQVEKSDLLSVAHAFSTRIGGVSEIPELASLNLGENRGDRDSCVEENLRRFLAVVECNPGQCVRGRQTHSVNVRTVTAADKGCFLEDTDGLVSSQAGIALMVKTADCVPILLWDPVHQVIGALHAGWRGSAGGIAEVGVKAMCDLGAEPCQIRVAIGACIHSCCFEVQSDFVDAVTALVGYAYASDCISQKQGRFYADLTRLNRRFLLDCGLLDDHIDISPDCTCCHPMRYFSHRATGGRRGTMGAVIVL